ISAFATGETWRIKNQQDQSLGAINPLGKKIHSVFSPPGVLACAAPSTANVVPNHGGLILRTPLHPGGVALLGLTAIPPDQVPSSAKQAVTPPAKAGDIVGTVWRDFKPG